MKKIILLGLISFSSIFAEIDDSSFKNTNRYELLPIKKISPSDSQVFEIKFVPPRGKKVNNATFVRLYEKTPEGWKILETTEMGESIEEFADNVFYHNTILNPKINSFAIEVDFIHCNQKGGQCGSVKYLSKLIRNKRVRDNKLNYTLVAK